MDIIDTTKDDFEDNLQFMIDTLIDQKLNQGILSIEDYMLVRSTDYLPENNIIEPLCNIPFLVKTNTPSKMALYTVLKEKYNVNPFIDDEKNAKLNEMVERYSPYSTQYRSTVHFTLNGLVTSHFNGSWDDQKFVIFDRLKNHINENIESLRYEDTFVKGTIHLSSETVILMEEDYYRELIKLNNNIENYNIVLYKGNRKLAVDYFLAKNGIIPAKINAHGIQPEGKEFSLLNNSINEIAKTYELGQDKHVYSQSYQEDDEKNLVLWQIYFEDFYNDLFEYFKIDDNDLYDYLINSGDRFGCEDKMSELIKKIGIEKFMEFIEQYNQKLEQAKSRGLLPNNDKIIEDSKVTINDQFRR